MKLLSSYNAHINTLFAIAGIFGFSMAILVFMVAPYFRDILLTDNVTIPYILPEILVLVLFSWFLRMVGRVGKTVVFFTLVFFQILLLSMSIFFHGTITSVAYIVAHFASLPFLIMLLDMILEAHSKNEDSGRVRGLYIFFSGVGFIAGPVVGGFLADRYGFTVIFFVAIVCYVVIFLLALSRYLTEGTSEMLKKVSLLSSARQLGYNRDMRNIYIISFLLEGFYTMSVITFPIILIKSGLTLAQAGLIFTVMILPFIVFSYPAGCLADRRWGEKEILVGAMVFLGIALLVISQTESGGMFLWMGLFFATRVGAAIMETMRDSYFYKRVDGDDLALISFFRTARAVGSILAAGITFLFLYFGRSYGEVFIFFSVCFFMGIILALQLKDSEPERAADKNEG